MYIIIGHFVRFMCEKFDLLKYDGYRKQNRGYIEAAVLCLYIASIAKHTIRNDFGDYCDFFRAISIEPFRDDANNTV